MKKKAVSLKYLNTEYRAPKITAIGSDSFAEKIISEAVKNNIKVINDETFFKYEKSLSLNQEIPEELYELVSKILSIIVKSNIR